MATRAEAAGGARAALTTLLLVAARGLDALSTWMATPDLALEANPLQRGLHAGWSVLLLVNALVVIVMAAAAWRAAFAPPVLPRESGLDLDAFVARYWFSTAGRRSIGQAVFWLPADRRVRWAFIGGPGAVLVIAASVAAAAWNLLVARRVVVAPAAGHLWLVMFWSAVVIGLYLAVRIFLRRAYARYLLATAVRSPT